VVLNPVIDGLRREIGLLSRGLWPWVEGARRFEYHLYWREYVSELYSAVREDFEIKNPARVADLAQHDAALDRLRGSVESAFDRLVGPEAAALQGEVKSLFAPQDAERYYRYYTAAVAGGYREMREGDILGKVFDSHPELRERALSLVEAEMKAVRDHAGALVEIDKRLADELAKERTLLADQYGVRVMPVVE